MADNYYVATFEWKPPRFFKKEATEATFARGILAKANTAALANEWRLKPANDAEESGTNDPLASLSRMGLLDLISHDEDETVCLVVRNKRKNNRVWKKKCCDF